jgi:probable DNA repair protein
LAGLDDVLGEVSFDEATGRLRRIARARQFQPDSATAPVQILGVWESGGLSFDHLWIAGMDADSWPGAGEGNPFLPRALQLKYGLPASTPERRLEAARRLGERMLGSMSGRDAPAVISHVRTGDGGSVSPLFGELPESDPLSLPGGSTPSFRMEIHASRRIETLVDDRGRPFAGDESQPVVGGTRVFADQAACPFRAFVRARLGAADPVSASEGLDARDRGQLLHDALEGAWGEIGSQARLRSLAAPELAGVIAGSIDVALERLAGRRSVLLDTGFRRRERGRLRSLLLEWLEGEKSRAPFRVVGREVRRTLSPAGLPIAVRVDRIDELEDGGLVLIDYKTRAPGPAAWEGDRPSEPQLPLYAVGLAGEGKGLAGVLFAEVRKGGARFRGLARAPDIAPGAGVASGDRPIAARVAEWAQVLGALATEFRSGQAKVAPVGPEACRYCDLGAICRIREQEESG